MTDALLLLGPTASGKSAYSLALAKKFDIEIISIDSALVYRGMDIGSAKPTQEEVALCPHHLINIREINEPYSAADFVEDAERLIAEIRQRGRFPLIVGGTMLYAKALLEGLNQIPTSTPQARQTVAKMAQEKGGWPQMHEALKAIDPKVADRLNPNDSQRIARAWEVWLMSGKPLSQWHEVQTETSTHYRAVGLMPGDRKKLHERIESRFDQMLKEGFLDEVKTLMKSPRFNKDAASMRAVGYRQAIDYLEGVTDFDAFHLAGVASTRQLAKRQMTWMRSMKGLILLDPFTENTMPQLEEILEGLGVKHRM